MKKYQGRCYCGSIKFEVTGDPLFTQHCHCEKCREVASLSRRDSDKIDYSFTAAYLTNNLTITKDESKLETLARNSSNLLLCHECKSLIYGISQDPEKQKGIGINVTHFDFESGLPNSFKPDKHIWYENRIVDIDDQLPKYKDAPKEQLGSGELISNH